MTSGLPASYIAIVCMFIFSFGVYRSAIGIITRDMYNRSHYRRIVKGQNFLDWLFYRRFRDVLPKYWIVNYYLLLILFFAVMISTTILHYSGIDDRVPLIIYLLWFMITIFPRRKSLINQHNRKNRREMQKKRLKKLKQQRKKQERLKKLEHSKEQKHSKEQEHSQEQN